MLDPQDPELPAQSELAAGTWYFGVLPRGKGGTIETATCVWADFDHGIPTSIAVPVTATVHSGRPEGLHAYWALSEETTPVRAVGMTRLAAMAWNGDRQVCEPKRVMRVPGSYNYKYNPPKMCALASLSPNVSYTASDLEEQLVGAVLASVWEDGIRHQMALGAGATLCRAGWPRERIESAVKWACEAAGDHEVNDRVTAAGMTVERKEAGTLVSARDLREAMGDLFKEFLVALGITARDGEVLSGGEKIGHTTTLERDLANLILAEGDWAYADGGVVRWNGIHWKHVNPEELKSSIFRRLAGLTVVQNGDEVDFNATAKLAGSIREIVLGWMMERQLDDPDPDDLPVKNGILSLKTRTLRPHEKEARHRWILPAEYDESAACPSWAAFLSTAVKPDESRLLQEWLGYLLTSSNPWQRMLWLYGPTSTGKSTYLHAVIELLKPAVAAVSSAQLSDYSIAELAGKRVGVCSELPSSVLRTTTLKALVSSDPVQARRPYGRPFPMAFTGKIVWASNALPPVDQGEGVWRRIVLMPFMNRPAVPDLKLKEKINAELSGILNWALDGLDRVVGYLETKDWPYPATVAALIDEYREGADLWAQFGSECLVVDEKAVTPLTDIYQVYHAWAVERGVKPEPMGPLFRQALKQFGGQASNGPKRVGKKVARCWDGLKLQEESFLGGEDGEVDG
jgi:P4 family phage/plasmid primase-like protien